ncbi:MAG: OmpA family protein, partial [Desulfuromusa sp.]|nr:OmpA family protein [Desulfuromusa sp.]
LSNPLTLNPTGVFHVGEPLFLRITDGDQNLDPTLAETIIVTVTAAETGDREVLQLTETGPDTGIFTGYLGSTADPAGSDNGLISLVANGTLTAHYADIHDGSSTTVAVLVDPIGLVFDSSTGQPIDGVPVTLVDVATGLPATVFGDDGVSSYPSSVISGATTTDSSGHTYIPPAGGYRFPLIAPGHYRFEITPPAGYTAPSTVSTTEIQTLPGAPFAIEIGSRGEDFAVNAGPTVHIDTPIDPGPDAAGLWVKKEANKSWAAIGDFIAYHVTVLNAVRPATDVIAKDTLPLGFSYQKGSTRIDGKKSDDPKISSSGRTLTYHLGDLPSLSINEISYVIEVAAGAKLGEQENTAFATSQEGLISNTASAIVNIREDFMQSKSLLMGRVMVGSCEQPDTEMHGLVNAKIYLEDGTYVVTDEKGKYHFEGIEPGTHVVQLDLESLPESYETVTCEENTQFAGRNFSQFIDLQGGTMWRADFHVGLKEKSRGKVSIELNGSQENGHISFRIPVQISTVPLRDLRLKIQIPQGLEYIQDSSRLNETDILTPEMQDGALIYHLNDRPVGWNGIISLQTKMTEDYPEELSTRAFLTFNSPDQEDQQTPATDNLFRNVVKSTSVPSVRFDVRPNYKPLATELSSQDKEFLDQLVEQMRTFEIDKLYAIGHTDNLRITQRSLLHFADNFVLSAARARNVAEYLATALNLPPEKVISVGVAGAVPVADNTTAKGRSLNR